MATFKQGDTTAITMELSSSLGDNNLKLGIYTKSGQAVYVTTYPDGDITLVDSTHLALALPYSVTRRLVGNYELRLTVFSSDGTLVNAGETSVPLEFVAEPVNDNLLCS